ncbi:PREDICTED: uncharacterized protein LOC104813862 [Tarenaya hassleriana]|uniref:uncharacterized protein LOC104813862 n=1 Tax=Tarenaya hassleriana TaxID=28532 RepID=UPI00053C4270|nr:PREDICTED: uncharacterized protein LOC104813862 [Tarenaya hassleriana]
MMHCLQAPRIVMPCARNLRPRTRISSTAIEAATSSQTHFSCSSFSSSPSMPRRLILLRHAHSSWDDSSLRDHERPLSKAGRADAAKVSQIICRLGWVPQLILSSDAARTRETLRIMQDQVGLLMEVEVHFIPSFYSIAAMDGQTAEHIQRTVCRFSTDEITTVMCMGHNKGWEEAASFLAGAPVKLETCNAALLQASGKSWEEAFDLAGPGGWELHGVATPDSNICV